MLTLIGGKDNKKSRQELLKRVNNAKKNTNRELVRIEEDDETKLLDILGSTSLFGVPNIVLVDNPSWLPDFIELNALDLQKSPHDFYFFCESAPAKEILEILKKAGAVSVVYDLAFKKEREFNNFALSDAYGERDKKRLWVLYQSALRAGVTSEELLGVLFWQAKTLAAVFLGESSHLSPFVKSKALRFAKNYSIKEINAHLKSLVEIYHRSHQGIINFEYGIERFILSL